MACQWGLTHGVPLLQGKFEEGYKLILEATSEQVPQHIRDKQPFACIQLLCELANINITKAWAETKSSERNPFLLQANNVIDRARVLDPTDQLVHLSSAHLSFAQVCMVRPHNVSA